MTRQPPEGCSFPITLQRNDHKFLVARRIRRELATVYREALLSSVVRHDKSGDSGWRNLRCNLQ
jgi:hypothetical protein